jgi:uncharacterized protein (TIGR03437 family)
VATKRPFFLLFLFILIFAAAGRADGPGQLPSGADWLNHLNNDLLPFWNTPAALGNPIGAFPSVRCDDGSVPDPSNPCPPISGNAYLMAPERYLVPLSRQIYGYGVAYHLTGDPKYFTWMKAGVDYILKNAVDPAGGMFTQLDLSRGIWGVDRELRDPQQLGYGLLGLGFYYYLTHDDTVLPTIASIKTYIISNYYNTSMGTMQWLLRSNGDERFDQKNLVADLDQMNTYLVLLAPIVPEPNQSDFKQTLSLLSRSILGTFYSPSDNLMFLAANTTADRDINVTGVDNGHTSKALWMIRYSGQLTGDQGLAHIGAVNGWRHLERSFVPEDGSWAQGVLPGGAQDKNKNWWVYCELDQLAATLALDDPQAGRFLPQTTAYLYRYFVDHQYGDVWNGVTFGTNAPQRDMPKAWQWKNACHDFEHALVGYITSQQLLGQPFQLHYAFPTNLDLGTVHPYFFQGDISLVMGEGDSSGHQSETVTFLTPSPATTSPIAIVSAASYFDGPQAPGSLVTIMGTELADAGKTTVSLTDSTGVQQTLQVVYASPNQLNILIPAATHTGTATLTVLPPSGVSVTATAEMAATAPGLFQLNGLALAAAGVVRVRDGQQTFEDVYSVDATNSVLARPIDLGPETDSVYLSIYATGLRNSRSVSVTVGGHTVPVLYFGGQGTYEGLDQVNVGPLPRSIAGNGKTTVLLVADGQTANPVELLIL